MNQSIGNKTHIRQEEDHPINLDLSVLAERNGTRRELSIMDRHGISVFEWEIEQMIEQYGKKELQKDDYYKNRVFGKTTNLGDQELTRIKAQVFQAAVTPAKNIRQQQAAGIAYGNIILAGVVFVLVLGVGIGYGKKKKKNRQRQRTDTDYSYDES